MMDKPLISVIIPTYKRSNFLPRAIKSVLDQTYTNFEIVVIDDNNPNSEYRKQTEKLMGEFENNPRIIYIQHDHNKGAAASRNTGIYNCSGQYIAFLDDDDVCTKDRLKKQYSVFEQNRNNDKLALVYCYSIIKSNNLFSRDFINKRTYCGNCVYEFMYDGCIAATSQWMCKKSVLLELNGFKSMPSKEESDMMFRILLSGYTIDYYPEALVTYNNHPGEHLSGTSMKQIEAEKIMLQECRREYWRLNSTQILTVEIAYSKRLYWLYKQNCCYPEMKKVAYFLRKTGATSFLAMIIINRLKKIKHLILSSANHD